MTSHRSVSQLESWIRCGEQYRLERVAGAPSRPAAWFHQGTAFHKAVEAYERGFRRESADTIVRLYESEYDALVAADREREPDLSMWMTGGRVRAEDDIARRRERGANQVRGYIEYVRRDPGRPWLLPGGEPAIEVEFSLDLDGIEVVGVIDQIWQWETGQVGPRDYKTGRKTPAWPIQLGVYGLAIEEEFGFRPAWGDYYMAKNNAPGNPISLAPFTRDRITRWFHDLDRAVRSGIFLPSPGDGCRTCGVSAHCQAVGHRADEYPPGEVIS